MLQTASLLVQDQDDASCGSREGLNECYVEIVSQKRCSFEQELLTEGGKGVGKTNFLTLLLAVKVFRPAVTV